MVNRLADMRKRRGEHGFTLIELLVVIIILGILAAVVVFSVSGINNTGEEAADAIDERTLRTAEEAFFAQNGRYASEQDLVDAGFLNEKSVTNDIALTGSPDPASAFDIVETPTETVNIAANADQWQLSDTGSGPGYSSSAFVYPLNSNLNEPLIIMASNYTLQPGLASSWERIATTTPRTPPAIHSPYTNITPNMDRPYNNATYRFHLRQNVTWHDGSPFDADDVIWTWRDRPSLSGSPLGIAAQLGYTQKLSGSTADAWDSVEKIDQYTVDFTPKTTNERIFEQIVHPKGAITPVLRDAGGVPLVDTSSANIAGLSTPRFLGRHLDGSTGGRPASTVVFGAASPPATPNPAGTPTGTGPFSYISYSPTLPQGGGTAAFQAYDAYWGSRAQVLQMNYSFIADPTQRTSGLLSGQYDMAIDLNPLDVDTVNTDNHVVFAPFGQNALIYINKVVIDTPASLDLTKVPPEALPSYRYNIGTDPAVRKALSLSLDRAAYVSAIFDGNADPGRWMSPPGILGAHSGLVTPMATNLASARTELDNAGWTCFDTGLAAQGLPGAGTTCAVGEFRKWNGPDTTKFATGRVLRLDMIGISLIPQAAYDLLEDQVKAVGIDLHAQRATCDGVTSSCPGGGIGRGQMYASSMWDLDLELPNQNDANPAFLPVLRMGCAAASNFRFAPADGTNGVSAAPVANSAANGGGFFPFGNTPCTSPGAVLGPFDNTWITGPAGSNVTTDSDLLRVAAANQMKILVNQDQTNVVVPIVGQYRIYGMDDTMDLGDPHPSQTSQRWVSLTKTA